MEAQWKFCGGQTYAKLGPGSMDHPMDPGGVFLIAIAIWKCWNENSGGRNALDLMHDSKRVCGLPIYGGAIPKQLAITRQTLED